MMFFFYNKEHQPAFQPQKPPAEHQDEFSARENVDDLQWREILHWLCSGLKSALLTWTVAFLWDLRDRSLSVVRKSRFPRLSSGAGCCKLLISVV